MEERTQVIGAYTADEDGNSVPLELESNAAGFVSGVLCIMNDVIGPLLFDEKQVLDNQVLSAQERAVLEGNCEMMEYLRNVCCDIVTQAVTESTDAGFAASVSVPPSGSGYVQ